MDEPDEPLTRWMMADFGGDLDPVGNAPSWHRRAACRGRWTPDDDPWFDPPHDAALEVCATCPVRGPCGDFAAAEGIVEGVWGGMSPKARQTARRAA